LATGVPSEDGVSPNSEDYFTGPP